jgi:hypothetical protein
MILEARAQNCCSATHLLKLDDRPCGSFDSFWFAEGFEVQLLGRRRWRFEKAGWLSGEFLLKDADSGEVVGRAVPAGFFTSAWDLELSIGAAKLVSAGWFQSAYRLQQDGNVHAEVDRLGFCERGWKAVNTGALSESDLLLAGLIYHVILLRQQRAAAAAGSHGS